MRSGRRPAIRIAKRYQICYLIGMNAGRTLRHARRRAELSQRELASRVALSQPAIARIESGRVTPRVDTLERLLNACGEALTATDRLGIGVDRSLIREELKLTPRQRIEGAAAGAMAVDQLRRGMRRAK